MPGLVPMRRSLSSVEEDAEGHESNQASGGDSHPQTGANKRARTTPEGGSRRTTGDSWRLDTPQTVARPRQRPASDLRHSTAPETNSCQKPPEHQPGSIVRVTLKDFVTYNNATFYPGPSLNMVIGPNGTGKSTLVCAICLGLGWGTANLGRSKEVVEFIKHGTSKAIIEIELKGRPGHTNLIIKRQIDHQKGGNHWWINGQASNEKQARSEAERFNIQIDNLCQFLPQDRVAEFARMTPVAKLAATIRAAAPQEMIEQHEQLKQLRKQQGGAETELSGSKSHLATLEKKQDSQRAEVDKIRERQQIAVERDFVQKQKPNAEYAVAKENFLASKAALTLATAELQSLKEEVEPSMQAINAKEYYQKRVESVCSQRKNLFRNVEKSIDSSFKKGDELSNKLKTCDNRRTAEKNARKARGKKIAVVKSEIEGIEKALENAPPAFDPIEYNERRRAKQRVLIEEQESQRGLEASKETLETQVRQKKGLIEAARKDKVSLATEVGQRDTLLRSAHAHAHKAWQWIEEQQREGPQSPFTDKVYGPALLECSVTDESWADAIESVFQRTELTAITCTNREDFNFLSNKLHGELGLSDVSLREIRTPFASFKPPVNQEEMKRLHISGWAIDYLKGPEPVLAMLCDQKQPHRMAVLQQEEDRQLFDRLSAHDQVDSWMTRNNITNIKRRREYNASSTTTRNITQARYWVSRPVDTTAIHDLDDNIAGWQAEVDAIMAKGRTKNEQLAEIRDKVKELDSELVCAAILPSCLY